MEAGKQTPGEYFKMITVLHYAMLMGQVIFGIVAFYIVSGGQIAENGSQLNDTFRVIVPLMIMGGLTASWYFTRTRIEAMPAKSGLIEKLVQYRTVFIIKLALLEAPSLLAIVAFLLTGNFLYLALAGLVILVFVINRPTKFKIANELKLDQEERALIDDPNARLS
jgi:hypothetical protein